MKLIVLFFAIFSLPGFSLTIKFDRIPKFIQEASFCIAYEVRDADKREERLVTAGPFSGEPDPDGKAPYIPHNILLSRSHLDIASLISRTTKQKKLTKKQLASLNAATFQPKSIYPQMDCHDPHHIFIFYNEQGMPIACLEVCFSCNSIKYADKLLNPPPPPENKSENSQDDPFEDSSKADRWRAFNLQADMGGIARLCNQLGLSLGKFKSLESYQKARKPVDK